jgi:recombination protein RecT
MSNIVLAVKNSLIAKESQLTGINPSMDFGAEANFAMQAISANSYLQSCSPESLVSAVKQSFLTGLSLNPMLQHGYLVPRKGKAVFQPGYQGLIYLLVESGLVNDVTAEIVCEFDKFHRSMGTNPKIEHEVGYGPDGSRGRITGAYAIAHYPSGAHHIEYMSVSEIMAVAMKSDMNKSKQTLTGAWASDFAEMCRKTLVRRLFKYIPKRNANSAMVARLTEAIKVSDAEFESKPIDTKDLLDADYEILPNGSSQATNGAAISPGGPGVM